MVKIVKQNNQDIMKLIRNGAVDAIQPSTSDFIDEIFLTMKKYGVTDCVRDAFVDKRADNTKVPFDLMVLLSIAAKMKSKSNLSFVPYALSDHRVISELGYNMLDLDRDLGTGLMSEGTIRHFLDKYTVEDLISFFNNTVQNHILPKMNISADIHLIDGTYLEHDANKLDYEGSGMVYDGKEIHRGFKAVTLIGVTGDKGMGIIEEIRFGQIQNHDSALSKDLLFNSPVLKNGDLVIADRGFVSCEVTSYLKNIRGVNVIMPLKDNMHIYHQAIDKADKLNLWKEYRGKKKDYHKIALVPSLIWANDTTDDVVEVNCCVLEYENREHTVFVCTDLSLSAKQIEEAYGIRWEIEEDFRQMKQFWNLEKLYSKKIVTTVFHLISLMLGYLFFQIFTLLPEGKEYANQCLPVIQDKYKPNPYPYFIIYSGDTFGILGLDELLDIYSECDQRVKNIIKKVIRLLRRDITLRE